MVETLLIGNISGAGATGKADDISVGGATPIIESSLARAVDAAIARRQAMGWPEAERAAAAGRAVDEPPVLPPGWVERFELTVVDQTLLEIALAADDPGFYSAFGLLSGDDRPGLPTVALACELAGLVVTDPAVLARLNPLAPLRRFGLLILDGPTLPVTARRLRVPDRVRFQVRGDDAPDPAIVDLLVEPLPLRLSGTDDLATALYHGAALCWVEASPGSAALACATAGCYLVDLPPLVADLDRLPTVGRADGDRNAERVIDPAVLEDALRLLTLEADLTGSVLVLLGADVVVGHLGMLRRSAMPIIAIGSMPWSAEWASAFPTTIVAPRLSGSERERLWNRLLPEVEIGRDVVALRLAPEQIAKAAAEVRVQAGLGGHHPRVEDIHQVVRRFGRRTKSRGEPASLDDLVLPDHVRAEVARLLDWARYRDEVTAIGPVHGKGKGTGIAAMFSGSPGTGKTLAARVVADSLGIPLLQVELNSVISKWVGESSKNLEQHFAEAEAQNALLFFDEADSLFGSRSSVRDSHDRYANQEIAYLLQRMETFDGITILATNLRGNLDPAFARRLQFIVHFPDPDEATRARLWHHHIRVVDQDPVDPVDAEGLARHVELCGGDIRNVVLAGVYDAVAAGELLGMRHIGTALAREMAKLGRRVPTLPAQSRNTTTRTAETVEMGVR